MPESPTSDYYVVIHVWTTCDEHGVCVSKDSAEVIEIAWILINSKSLEEVRITTTTKIMNDNHQIYFYSPLAIILLMLTLMAAGSARRSPDQTSQHPNHLPLQYVIHQYLHYRTI